MTVNRWHSSTPRDRSCDHVTPLAPRPHGHEHAKKRMQRARSKRPMHAGVVSYEDPRAFQGDAAARWLMDRVCLCGFTRCAKRGPCAPSAVPAPATPAPRFKVGDRVALARNDESHFHALDFEWRGLAGEIVSGRAGSWECQVQLDRGETVLAYFCDLEPLAPAKPEAALRYASGEDVRDGDRVRRPEGTEGVLVSATPRADGQLDVAWKKGESKALVGSTCGDLLTNLTLLSRAPAAAGADALPPGWRRSGRWMRPPGETSAHVYEGNSPRGKYTANDGNNITFHESLPIACCAALSIKIEGVADGGCYVAFRDGEPISGDMFADPDNCARAALEAHHGRAREVGGG